MQSSEFTIYDGNKERLLYPDNATAQSIPIGVKGFTAEKLINNVDDGLESNKLCITSATTSWDITIDIGKLLPVRYYGYYTANDDYGRDPVSWTVDVSADGKNWHRASEVKDFQAISTRFALAGQWELKY